LLRGEPLHGIPEPDWITALDLAEQERLLPWAAACLSTVGPCGAQLTQRLREIRRNAQISAFLWTSTLKSTLAEFHSHTIPVIALKGPSLAERLYGDAALREYLDLDLLVRPRHLSRAEELLSALGFVPAGRRGDYERPWRRRSVLLELHHDVENPLAFDFRIADAWQRARLAEFHGVPVHLLAPADEFLFVCLHGVRHRFGQLRLILDLVLAFRAWPESASLPLHGPAADRLVAIAARMAARLDPRVAIPDPPSLHIRDREALDALADRLWQERLGAPAPALDWRAKHLFYLAVETRPWSRSLARFRQWRILLTRLIEPDFSFAAQFHLRRSWQAWLLRPLRLLLKAARASSLPG
ncbi:MAG: nucleotidyltransferase family protein, partial [Acidobacteriaceae bacterium]